MAYRVLIYEDNPDLRSALSIVIGGAIGFELCGAFESCVGVETQVPALKPHVILMDIDLPGGMNGIEATARLKKVWPATEVLMLTIFDDDERVFQAICAGASGYLLKRTPMSRILSAIEEVCEGGAPMTPSIARQVLGLFPGKTTAQNDILDRLTDRETQVLKLLAKGNSQKMVAAELVISVGTVHSHVKKVYEKLHVHSVTEAISRINRIMG